MTAGLEAGGVEEGGGRWREGEEAEGGKDGRGEGWG